MNSENIPTDIKNKSIEEAQKEVSEKKNEKLDSHSRRCISGMRGFIIQNPRIQLSLQNRRI